MTVFIVNRGVPMRLLVVATALVVAGCSREQVGIFGAAMGGAASAGSTAATTNQPRYLKRSYISGSNRICIYTQGGNDYVTTIASTELCALN